MIRAMRILIVVTIVIFLGCTTDRRMWRKVTESDTIKAYQEYLVEYPYGKYKKPAKKKLEELIEYSEYMQAEKVDNLEAYQGFIKKYPNSQYVKLAEQMRNRVLDRNAFDQAKAVDSKEAFEVYLKAYPNGEFAPFAYQELDRLKALLDHNWALTQKSNMATSYETFLREHPHSEYTMQASLDLARVGHSNELDRIRGLIEELKESTPELYSKATVHVFAVRETTGETYFVYKDEKGIYYKVSKQHIKEFEGGYDLPLLKYAQPCEGVILYISYDEIYKEEFSQDFLGPMDHLFKAFDVSDESNLVFIKPKGVYYTRKFSNEEKEKSMGSRNIILSGFTTVKEQLVDLQNNDPAIRCRATKALGIFADPEAIEPLRKALQDENEQVRVEAKKALEYIEHADFFLAKSKDTVKAYQLYLRHFPKGKNVSQARDRIAEEGIWTRAKQSNNYKHYSGYLVQYYCGKHVEKARAAITKLILLSDNEINEIDSGNLTSNADKKMELVEKLLFTGANCLDKYADWKNRDQGRKIYLILKRCDSDLLTEAMTHAVLIDVNRKCILFLVVKLGVPNTEKSLNSLLMKYGSVSMAEDYLNSGSEELSDGGRVWASKNGYIINTGQGSHRVGWGRF